MSTESIDVDHLAFWLSSFWAALYILRHYRRRSTKAFFLPAPSSSAPSSSPDIYSTRSTRVTLRNFHLNIESTACNTLHQITSIVLKRHPRWRALGALAYDLGSVFGVLGMLGSVILLAWTTFKLGASSADHPGSPVHPPRADLHKRDSLSEDSSLQSATSYGHEPPLRLIVSTTDVNLSSSSWCDSSNKHIFLPPLLLRRADTRGNNTSLSCHHPAPCPLCNTNHPRTRTRACCSPVRTYTALQRDLADLGFFAGRQCL